MSNATPPFKRHVLIATVEKHNVFLTVEWDGKRLSFSGVEGPKADGNAWGSCGQIDMHEWNGYKAADGIDLTDIRDMWKRWHLNDMRAGNPKQEAWLRKHGHGKDYTETCAKLEAAWLLVNEGYKYGSEWKHENVPQHITDHLMRLPESKLLPATWA